MHFLNVVYTMSCILVEMYANPSMCVYILASTALLLFHIHREERVRALQRQVEWERSRVAALEAELEQMKSGNTAKSEVRSMGIEEDSENPLNSVEKQVMSGDIIRSASSSNLLASPTQSTVSQAVPMATHSTSHHGERRSITDMVSECLSNPSSMASIRSNLKADNLTPKIQRKFYHKTTPTSLPSMQAVTSPLARDGVRAGDSTSSSFPQSYKDK